MKPREHQERLGFTTSEFVEFMRIQFPKYSHAANSMCNHSAESGVCLTIAAERALKGTQQEKRTRPNKFTFRLLDATAELLRAYAEDEGKTIQTVVEDAIIAYLEVAT